MIFVTSSGEHLVAEDEPCIIGRSKNCTLHLPSPEISRCHAVVLRDGRDWWLADCGSRSGTWLNGTRVNAAVKLAHGDRIGVGLAILTFLPGAASAGLGRVGGSVLETTLPGDLDWMVTSGTAVVWLDPGHSISSASPEAIALLTIFFDGVGESLPACLVEWLDSGQACAFPYERRNAGERLRIDACPGKHCGDGHLLVLRRLTPAFGPRSLEKFGLSQAEALVVPWLVRGKRNEEIALIIGVSPRTVEKHVAAILTKFRVETRTAAAWTLIERSGAHG